MISYNFLLPIFSLAAVLTVVGIFYYKKIANRFGIIAKKNFRTLHEIDVPRGSGVIFSFVFLIFLVAIWNLKNLDNNLFLILLIGGFISALFGFLDDIINIKARIKLIVQLMLSGMVLYALHNHGFYSFLFESNLILTAIIFVILLVAATWFLNLINFIDGSDGLLATCTSCICLMLFGVLYVNNAAPNIMILSGLLAVVCMAFLIFNWPPASVFMGDAGSLFIAFTLGIMVASTIVVSVDPWLWLIMLAYILVDTCLTLLLRIALVKKWYGAHRSHAYQNFVRIRGEHKTVLYIILAYHVFWLMPLLALANINQNYQIVFAVLALLPAFFWTLKYGPLLSSD